MFPTAALILLALGFFVAVVKLIQQRKGLSNIRGPPSTSTLLGHDYDISRQSDVGNLELEWLKEYGPTWKYRGFLGENGLMTADPKALQHIFHKSGYNWAKKPAQNHLGYLMAGPNIAWVHGEDHQRHRRIMNPAFSAAQLRSFLPLFQRIGTKLAEKWKTELATKQATDVMVNVWLSRASLDIIGEAAFDYDYNALDGADKNELSKAYHGIFMDADSMVPPLTMAFRATWDYLPEALLKTFKYIPVAPFTRLHGLNKVFSVYGEKILREKAPTVDTEKQAHGRDVMSILINANNSGEAKKRLTNEELKAEMFTLTLAGHETTSNTMTFILYELARHPEYQARMRAEIKETRARVVARGDIDLTIEDLDSMATCTNAIKETLRFHTIAAQLPRVATKDDILPLAYPITGADGKTITEIPMRKGQFVVCSFATYNRLPQVWGEDAGTWNPDRWTKLDTGKQTNVGVFANLMTFSAGTRACIGWRFSVIEMQALLAEIVERFQFSLPSGSTYDKTELQRAPTMIGMMPLIRDKPEIGPALRLAISVA
ncbi:PAH-inducible cytochrome P450 monooxygenase PC-PAH 4 [Trametes elegans]|nr:PAH-inducible cytochrome P450 monooxygenase PC-PAH 4 [Trametes elegans]